MKRTLAPTLVALLVCFCVAAPAHAADRAALLKGDIDAFIDRIEQATQGYLKWEGAERFDVHQEADAAIADIADARIAIRDPDAKAPAKSLHIRLDHLAIRQEPAADDRVKLSFVLPENAVLEAGGDTLAVTLDKAAGETLLDAKTSRALETGSFAGARITVKKSGEKTGDWLSVGPASLSSKLVGAANGAWTAPLDIALKDIQFFVTQGSVAGAIERIAYTARSAGPDLAALNRLRDRLDALRNDDKTPPEKRLDALLELLSALPTLFSEAKGEFTIDGLVARGANGDKLVALDKASIGGALSGLAGDAASLRITVRDQGLALAPAILAAGKVPRRAVLDFGLENVATAPLRTMVEAAGRMRAGATDADKQKAMQQVLAATAMLSPVLRLYDLSVDTPDVGVDASAEAGGSPISPKGYTAGGDVVVRGFDALPQLIGQTPLAVYLPLLHAIGDSAAGPDGKPRVKFHLASAPGKWLTLNGVDITPWFASSEAKGGPPRTLRPHQPPLSGADVVAVQDALNAANVAVPKNGSYDGATAAAVARFQKRSGLNADGVVDAATRQKLGIKPPATQQLPAK
ncbi:MAG: peptidoglycan-binding domain-containing protein [Thiohalocapsa sp.]